MVNFGTKVIRNSLSILKKKWGVPVTWQRYVTSTFDVTTGLKNVEWDTANISRGILMPRYKDRKEAGVASKPFDYGGYFDIDARHLIVDARDIPTNWEITETDEELNDVIIIDHQRYKIKSIAKYELGVAYILYLKHIVGSEPDAVIDQIVDDGINLKGNTDG